MAAATLTAGDTRPTRLTYKVAGQPVDITDYAFTLKIGYKPEILAKAAVVADGPKGILEFPWASGDLVAGTWTAEILVVDAAGKEKTHKIPGLKIEPRMT